MTCGLVEEVATPKCRTYYAHVIAMPHYAHVMSAINSCLYAQNYASLIGATLFIHNSSVM